MLSIESEREKRRASAADKTSERKKKLQSAVPTKYAAKVYTTVKKIQKKKTLEFTATLLHYIQ